MHLRGHTHKKCPQGCRWSPDTQWFTDMAHKIITDECTNAAAPSIKKVEIYPWIDKKYVVESKPDHNCHHLGPLTSVHNTLCEHSVLYVQRTSPFSKNVTKCLLLGDSRLDAATYLTNALLYRYNTRQTSSSHTLSNEVDCSKLNLPCVWSIPCILPFIHSFIHTARWLDLSCNESSHWTD